jgi:antitoxin (DNA-binding transcriptional repressor) of toxin-antitoxin stability system
MKATIHEAKTQLSKVIEHPLAGEEMILTDGRSRTSKLKLVPVNTNVPIGEIQSLPVFKDGKRPIGLYEGQIEIGPEFFDPLPEEELALWEGNEGDATLFRS